MDRPLTARLVLLVSLPSIAIVAMLFGAGERPVPVTSSQEAKPATNSPRRLPASREEARPLPGNLHYPPAVRSNHRPIAPAAALFAEPPVPPSPTSLVPTRAHSTPRPATPSPQPAAGPSAPRDIPSPRVSLPVPADQLHRAGRPIPPSQAYSPSVTPAATRSGGFTYPRTTIDEYGSDPPVRLPEVNGDAAAPALPAIGDAKSAGPVLAGPTCPADQGPQRSRWANPDASVSVPGNLPPQQRPAGARTGPNESFDLPTLAAPAQAAENKPVPSFKVTPPSPRALTVATPRFAPAAPAATATPAPMRVAARREQDAAMAAVTRQGEAKVRRAFQLAERGALYSARAELIQVLRLSAQSLDAQTGSRAHSEALAAGLDALKEASDFAPQGTDLEAHLNLPLLIASHRTPILKQAPTENLMPLAALQRYYTYAQEQFALAAGNLPVASAALYGLGRVQTVIAQTHGETDNLSGPKMMTYYQAALLVDEGNYRAANELGVLLARYGQFEDARRVLVHSVSVHSQPESWHNLAVVHDQLGQSEMAQRARFEAQLASQRKTPNPDGLVRWVEPAALQSRPGDPAMPQSVGTLPPPSAPTPRPAPATDKDRTANRPAASGSSSWLPWKWPL